MTITTTYTCDRCAVNQTTDEQFWKIGVTYATLNSSFPQPTFARRMHVCRICAEELGLVPPATLPAPPPPTLEDLIREIIQSELDK
jgi:hypothetical protein